MQAIHQMNRLSVVKGKGRVSSGRHLIVTTQCMI